MPIIVKYVTLDVILLQIQSITIDFLHGILRFSTSFIACNILYNISV